MTDCTGMKNPGKIASRVAFYHLHVDAHPAPVVWRSDAVRNEEMRDLVQRDPHPSPVRRDLEVIGAQVGESIPE